MTSKLFEDLPALFGAPLPKDGLMVREKYGKSSAYREKKQVKVLINLFFPPFFVKGSFGGVSST